MERRTMEPRMNALLGMMHLSMDASVEMKRDSIIGSPRISIAMNSMARPGFQHVNADDLRKLAERFTAIADELDREKEEAKRPPEGIFGQMDPDGCFKLIDEEDDVPFLKVTVRSGRHGEGQYVTPHDLETIADRFKKTAEWLRENR